ncbi:hypothetical protein EPUL_005830, partial [Erysiphe pulchra]
PYLALRYNCHINVEVCESVQSIRYIHKYVYKGDDRTTVEIETDEIKRFVESRYISPMQAAYRMLEYPTHSEYPPVVQLTVHLESEQSVLFPASADEGQLRHAADVSRTTLMAYLEYNRLNEDGRTVLYQDFPEKYVYQNTRKPYRWTRRARGFAIGRMVHLSPRAAGATSFDDLKFVNGQRYATFKDACVARQLLEDDGAWSRCFEEAAGWSLGGMRVLFVMALVSGEVTDPVRLWERFKAAICEDCEYRIRRTYGRTEVTVEESFDYGLFLIEQELSEYGRSLGNFQLPSVTLDWTIPGTNYTVHGASDFDADWEASELARLLPMLNEGQRAAYENITNGIFRDPLTAHFFLQGAGG